MASVYILFSQTLSKYYVGSCKDLEQRIMQHHNKEFGHSFTAKANDWILYLSVDNLDYEEARNIEKHIKKMKSKTYIQNLKKYPEIIVQLLTY